MESIFSLLSVILWAHLLSAYLRSLSNSSLEEFSALPCCSLLFLPLPFSQCPSIETWEISSSPPSLPYLCVSLAPSFFFLLCQNFLIASLSFLLHCHHPAANLTLAIVLHPSNTILLHIRYVLSLSPIWFLSCLHQIFKSCLIITPHILCSLYPVRSPSYLVSGGVFSSFSLGELFSRPWIRLEAFILQEQETDRRSRVLMSYFRFYGSCQTEAFEKGVNGGIIVARQQ